jgi:hypothetical protein
MASINTPVIATAFGAIDADAIVDGRAIDAKTLHAMELQANRLVTQGHQAFNLTWPEYTSTIEGVAQHVAEWGGSAGWTLVVPPIPIEKLPGLVTGTVHFRANIPSGSDILFAVETGAETNGRVRRTKRCAGTGALADYSLTGVNFLPGGEDVVRIYQKSGDVQGSLLVTGTYGTHDEATITSAADSLTHRSLTDASAAWGTGTTNLTTGKHTITLITDYGGTNERPLFTTDITWNTATSIGWNDLNFTESIDVASFAMERIVAQFYANVIAIHYQIRKVPEFALTQVLGVMDGRTA